MFKLAIKESLDRKFKRLRTKDKEMLQLIEKKVNEILADPYRFKPLRKPMQNKRRVHVGGPFVLICRLALLRIMVSRMSTNKAQAKSSFPEKGWK